MTALLAVTLLAVGVLVGALVKSRRIYAAGVRAGQALEANAHGTAVASIPRRRVQDWQPVDRNITPTREHARTR